MATTRNAVRQFAATIALGALAFSPSALLAQDSDRADPDALVVEGRLPDDGVAARDQARDITLRLGTSSEPLARFRSPICPGVWGLSPENAQLVIDRIYDNAERAGLEVAEDADCPANVWVIVTDDPAMTFDDLRDDNSWMTRGLTRAEANRVEDQDGPVRAWNIASTRSHTGQRVTTGFEAVAANMESQASGGLAGGAPAVQTFMGSRTESSIRRDIDLSVVMIARSAIASFDAFSIADYATMRALARTEEPERDGMYDSIMTLFQDDYTSDRLTAFDISYLRAVYQGNGYRVGTRALSSLDELMVEELTSDQ